MGRTGKIEQFQLQDTITRMSFEDGLNGKEISDALKARGYSVSHATVCRWLQEQRAANADTANKIFADHVTEHMPKDLEALEAMEALCLTWANEDGADRVQRISSWFKVTQLVPEYAHRLNQFLVKDEKEKAATVKQFISEIMAILVEDIDLVKQRLAAISQGTKIIETKLRNAGVIGDSDKGNIVIKGYDEESHGSDNTPDDGEPGRRILSFRGGNRE